MSALSPAYLFALLSAVLYVIGALLVKRAAELGVGVWRTAFVSHFVSMLVYLPLLLFGGEIPSWTLLWQPGLIALCWLGGQVFLFLSLDRGDVSVATPVLGVKIILVALFVTLLLGEKVPAKLWIAAGLSSTAIALLNRTRAANHHHVGQTILYALMSAASYAMFDVLIQKWSPVWGVGRLLPATAGFLMLFSFGIVPLFRAPLSTMSRLAWAWLLAGTFFIALQSVIFVTALGIYRQATAVNVIYSSRGLWSVIFVWAIGHWFHSQERMLGGTVLRWRLAGAALMTVAILLVLI